nr:MAG TPA: protein of unknown function (DUF1993) [Crassvirales sp.]
MIIFSTYLNLSQDLVIASLSLNFYLSKINYCHSSFSSGVNSLTYLVPNFFFHSPS